jgi:Mg2+-importing ATPase
MVFFYFRNFGEGILQSAWFLTSVLTEILIIFSLRTPQFFLKGPKPSFILSFVSIATVSLTLLSIFYAPLAEFFGFVSLDLAHLLIITGLVLSYFIFSEIIKIVSFKNQINHKKLI